MRRAPRLAMKDKLGFRDQRRKRLKVPPIAETKTPAVLIGFRREKLGGTSMSFDVRRGGESTSVVRRVMHVVRLDP